MKLLFTEVQNYKDERFEKKVYHLFDLEDRFERKMLHTWIDDQGEEIGLIEEQESSFTESYEEVMEEVEEIHDLISAKDYDGLKMGMFDYFDFDIVEETLQEALENKGYKVEKSAASCSLYVKIGDKEVRISDHERPSYQDESGIWHEWDYENNIVEESKKVTKEQLRSVGIELPEEEYYLY